MQKEEEYNYITNFRILFGKSVILSIMWKNKLEYRFQSRSSSLISQAIK